MKKLFIITLLFLIFSFWLYKVADNFETFFPVDSLELVQSWSIDEAIVVIEDQSDINKKIVAEKIAKLKNRYAQRGLILAWDDHLKNNEYLDALSLYNIALKTSPGDEELIKKVADTYFSMKKFSFAYKKYLEISDYSQLDKHSIWLALQYSNPYSAENTVFIKNELSQINLDPQASFYYTTMLDCVDDFHECKKTYWSHLDSYTGSLSDKLDTLSWAIVQYEAFQTGELYFKDTLVLKALYDDGNYPIVIELWKQILENQPGYRPVLKMIAQGYFELGDHDQAKLYLNQLYELDKTDAQVAYMLGVVNRELWEYILSNIFFSKAIENDYTPLVYPYRFLINNYLDLDAPLKALDWFRDLLWDDSWAITKDDLLLAGYYNILYDNLLEAERVMDSWIKSFPEEADFYWFLGWIYKEKLDFVAAMEHLQTWYELDPKNAMISLNIAQVYLLEKDSKQAAFYLKQTVRNDKNGQFWSVAQDLLDEL